MSPASTSYYATSPTWSDITPIPLLDSSSEAQSSPIQPLATIAYPPAYAEAMSYLRAVMCLNEFSRRALALTQDIISLNPAHYTVWLYRAKILKVLGDQAGPDGYRAQVKRELIWLDGVSRRNLKNYQIWHHRRTLVSSLPQPPANELAFLQDILALDAKNYHVWTYRQWLCRHFPSLLSSPDEMHAIEAMIDEDVRNNSAWNHRWFLCFGAAELNEKERADFANSKTQTGKDGNPDGVVVDEELIDREITYTRSKIRLAPQNASAWNYLRGLVRKAGRQAGEFEPFCREFVGQGGVWGEHVQSSHAIEWLAETYIQSPERHEEGIEYFNSLTEKWDPIRKGYWEYRKALQQ